MSNLQSEYELKNASVEMRFCYLIINVYSDFFKFFMISSADFSDSNMMMMGNFSESF